MAAALEPVSTARDRILLFGGSARTLDLLRLATIRSDDVLIVGDLDAATRRYASRFAVEHRPEPDPCAWHDASTVLIAIGDGTAENAVIHESRRHGIPVHVSERPLVSDFTLMEFLESRPATRRADPPAGPCA